MRIIFAVAILLACTMFSVAQDAIHLSADLEPGWAERYRLNSRIEIRADDIILDVLEQSVTLRLAAVAREDGAQGSTTLRATVERIDVTHTSAGDTVQVEFPAPDEEGDNDASPALARIYVTLFEGVLEFEILPTGRARLISGLDTALQAAQAADPEHPARLLGLFAPGAIERTIASIITLDPHSQPRKPGDTWRDEQIVPVIGRQSQLITDLSFHEIEDDEAHFTGDITVALLPAEAPAPTDPRISIAEQSGNLHARWDVTRRRLIERQTETRIVWHAQLATEPPIESRTTASSRLTVTHQPEPDDAR